MLYNVLLAQFPFVICRSCQFVRRHSHAEAANKNGCTKCKAKNGDGGMSAVMQRNDPSCLHYNSTLNIANGNILGCTTFITCTSSSCVVMGKKCIVLSGKIYFVDLIELQ